MVVTGDKLEKLKTESMVAVSVCDNLMQAGIVSNGL